MSSAPTDSQVIAEAACGAVVSTKKTIIVPGMVRAEVEPGESAVGRAGGKRYREANSRFPRQLHALSSDMSIPVNAEKRASTRYWMPITL